MTVALRSFVPNIKILRGPKTLKFVIWVFVLNVRKNDKF